MNPHTLAQIKTQLTQLGPKLRPHFNREHRSRWGRGWRRVAPVVLSGALSGGLLLGLKATGLFQGLELRTYDQMVRLRPNRGTDPRLLIITISESDIQAIKRWPIPDGIFANLFQQLQAHKPRAIGLDIYRDFPQPPGTNAFHQALQAPNIVTIKLLSTPRNPKGIPAPPSPVQQIGFNDMPIDPDSVVRRALLAVNLEGQDFYSFAYQLAATYLRAERLELKPTAVPDRFHWGRATLQALESTTGGYQNVDDGGYQLLLDYRDREPVGRTLSLTDALAGKFKPEWVQDKIILIGTNAPSSNDFFFTPYTGSGRGEVDMSGVMLHAQITSQLVGAVLGERSLFRFWPEWGESLWILGWSLLSAAAAAKLRHPLKLLLLQSLCLGLIVGIHWLLFIQVIWVPVLLPLLASLGGTIAMIGGQNYRSFLEQKQLVHQAEEQEQAILALRMALAQAPSLVTQIQRDIPTQTDGFLANRYQIEKVLAAGGFGVTYVAHDTLRPGSPECVVKRLRPGSNDPEFLEIARRLFKTEAEILEVLGRYDTIPELYAYFEEDGDFYLVEELISGHPLNTELLTDRRLDEAMVLEMLEGLLPTLQFIHDRHIIHRDIKPNNIIRRPDNALVLIDFGAVKQIKPQLGPGEGRATELNQTIAIGTQGYAAPEQLAGYPRISSDIYALGVIAIQALSGIPPYQMEQDEQTGNLIWEPFTRCSPEMLGILRKMTTYHFRQRYPDAIAVLQDLKSLTHYR